MNKQAESIIKIQQAVKEMNIANAYPDRASQKFVAHLAKIVQIECLKLIEASKS